MSEAQLMLIGHRCNADEPLLQIAHTASEKRGTVLLKVSTPVTYDTATEKGLCLSVSLCTHCCKWQNSTQRVKPHLKDAKQAGRSCKDKLSILSEVYSLCFIQWFIISSESYISLSLSRAVPRCLMGSFVFRRPNVWPEVRIVIINASQSPLRCELQRHELLWSDYAHLFLCLLMKMWELGK